MEKVRNALALGCLMYAMVCTSQTPRPDIGYALGVVFRFPTNPSKEHLAAGKQILKYLKGTSKLCLCFRSDRHVLQGFTNADLAGDIDTMKSTSGYLFTFSGGAVSWQSKLQKCVALSTTKSEYIAIVECCKEMLWLKRYFQELGLHQKKFVIHYDNQSAIRLSKNPSFHSKSKHIDMQYHWIRDKFERN